MDEFDSIDEFIESNRRFAPLPEFHSTLDFGAVIKCLSPHISSGADPSSAADIFYRIRRELAPPQLREFFPAFFGTPHSVSVGSEFALGVPTSTDVWYIHVGVTVLPPWSYSVQGDWYINQDRSSKVKELVSDILVAAGGISLLRCPRNASDLSSLENNGIETIKEARYECSDGGRSFTWPSRGPDSSRNSGVEAAEFNKNFCAYIAFPVGPIGPAVRTISLVVDKVSQSMKDEDNWHDSATANTEPGGGVFGGLFPPGTSDNDSYGLHLIEDYHKHAVDSLEYPASDYIGLPRHKKHLWFRYYIKKTCKFIVPGKFVGITIKPENFHCWWYQKSSPLLYSGAFFETRFYTSGKIIKVLSNDEKKHKEVGNVYVVRIRGVDIYVQSSDFLEYAIGDSVCVLKRAGISRPSDSAFPWLDMDDLDFLLESLGDDPSKGVYTLVKDYVIVPFTFYEEQAVSADPQPA